MIIDDFMVDALHETRVPRVSYRIFQDQHDKLVLGRAYFM